MVINLISSPRNISTALMYSFAQREDTKVVDEPFYSHYLTVTGLDHPGKDDIIRSIPSGAQEVVKLIMNTATLKPVLFIKNMAHHLIKLETGFLKQFKNVFLIRDPQQLITSFAKVIPHPTMNDIGVLRQYELYEELCNDSNCPVIDSGEVLKGPPKVLAALCDQLEIPFDEKMLSWEPGPLPEDGVWAKYWYANVHRSTGFQKNNKSATESFPENCIQLLEAAKPYYQKLKEKAIKT